MSKTESAKPDTSVSFRTSIGGQALIEGILMRGPTRQAIVCRTQDGMVEKVEELHWVREKHPILGWPLIRGVIVFLDSMVKGMKALTYSADLLPEDEQEEPGKIDLWIEKHFGEEKAKDIIIGTAVVLGIALSIVLFILIPTLLAGLTKGFIHSPVVRNLFEGLLRIVIFLLYLWGVAHMKDVERMFAYHGAEHKTIFCYEKGLPLTVENVRPQSRFHPRCGTSFLFVVVIISILVFSLVSLRVGLWDNPWVRIGLRLLLLPVVVSISYEINRWVGRHDNLCSRILSAPGKWLQRLTTNEPDDSMIECAIRALELVIPEQKCFKHSGGLPGKAAFRRLLLVSGDCCRRDCPAGGNFYGRCDVFHYGSDGGAGNRDADFGTDCLDIYLFCIFSGLQPHRVSPV